ncbi:linker for activation of T-cells family member 2 isoform X2 [Cygnus olor]|uniref:linker for activation of T-cells family member 2 isoform X2 n=2 Tax=Cygnus olor TaxID=8869 RepID=UPI001ADE6790|nr:linker for activation of T-cells family member 2 isoform X2 [Cygnus olor]
MQLVCDQAPPLSEDVTWPPGHSAGWTPRGHGAAGAAVGGCRADAARGGRQRLRQVPALRYKARKEAEQADKSLCRRQCTRQRAPVKGECRHKEQPEMKLCPRDPLGNQQSFEVIRSHSTVTRRLDQIKEPENFTITRKAHEELGASRPLGIESRTEPRYQNFLTEDYLCEDAAYVEPISVDFYEHAKCFTSPNAKEEDSHSYQNVFIGDTCGSGLDDVDDYENSTAIHAWKIEQSAALYIESQDEEPDYVNTDPASDPTLLSKQSKLRKV